MRLSTKGRYGTRAIIEIAKHYQEGPVKRRDIVETQAIPDSYLENILITLKAAGLVRTIRGAHGGYQITRDPTTIDLLEVIYALEGDIAPVYCLESDTCERQADCKTRSVWNEMYKAMEQVMRSYTLQDMVDRSTDSCDIDYQI